MLWFFGILPRRFKRQPLLIGECLLFLLWLCYINERVLTKDFISQYLPCPDRFGERTGSSDIISGTIYVRPFDLNFLYIPFFEGRGAKNSVRITKDLMIHNLRKRCIERLFKDPLDGSERFGIILG